MTGLQLRARRYSCRAWIQVGVLAGAAALASAAEPATNAADTFSRKATFELTFSNRDLIWDGDPGSPTATVYLKPGARPIATDMHVTTLVESSGAPARRYMREARIASEGATWTVYGFTKEREKPIGAIDNQGRFTPNEFYAKRRDLLPTWPADAAVLKFDAQELALYYEVEIPGPRVTERLDFLPLALTTPDGKPANGHFTIDFTPSEKGNAATAPVVSLLMSDQGNAITLAKGVLPKSFRRADVKLGSFDNASGSYLPEAAYRAGAVLPPSVDPSVTFAITGEFTSMIQPDGKSLVVVDSPATSASANKAAPAKITIDGNFDDWRNVAGIDDPRGDMVPYLEYLPDVDLLEFKVANDAEHIYLYARVAGQVGRTHTAEGRSYFYAYMDVDRNPETGFVPSRDDDCYYGVDLGDDCEVQFEFVDSTLRKTFYGFCGLGGDENILKQVVTRGRSNYGRVDETGEERANYKSEYILRGGVTEITEDLKLGTSDTIRMALSPDGSEVEIVSTFQGFLKDPKGKPTVQLGQKIDIAVGMECSGSKVPFEKSRWAADNTIAIRGYELRAP